MHMKNVIQGLDTSEEKQFVYGVDKYYYIYERMIDSIFSSGERIQDFYPKAKWKLIRPEIKEKDSSNLRPDTILLKDDSVYILDAKFYRFGVTANIDDLPNTSSIQKQITYGDFVKNNKSKKFDQVKNIYNAFLIPYNKFNNIFNSKEDLLYIGNAETDWKDKNNSHDKVHAFLIDLKHVIKTWNSYNHNDDINKLIEDILKYSKEKED